MLLGSAWQVYGHLIYWILLHNDDQYLRLTSAFQQSRASLPQRISTAPLFAWCTE